MFIIKKINSFAVIILTLVLFSGCSSVAVEPPTKITTIDLRAMQTREYDASKKVAIASVVEMFQDLGLVVDQLNPEYGIIGTKSGPLNLTPTKGGEVTFFGLTVPLDSSAADTGQGSANVQEIGDNRVSIRIGFNKIASSSTTTKKEDNGGLFALLGGGETTTTTESESNTSAVTDPEFYKAIFAKVEKSIFLKLNQ